MKTPTAFILSLTIIITLAAGSAFGAYSGGTGDANNPYQISNPGDWQTLMGTSADWKKQFRLTTDVNLAGVTLNPVGNLTTKFTGVFDGNDHIIRNIVINQPTSDYVGLFGYIGSGGQIRNLGIENVNVTGHDCVGGLAGVCGFLGVSGSIISCSITGTVSGSGDVGGLVGWGMVTITNCYSACTVSGIGIIGGLAGDPGGNVTGCSATGNVTSTGGFVGGLLGKNGGTTTDCHATGNVIGGGESVGGLVGWNLNTIRDCYATGTVSSSSNAVGGLAGMNWGSIRNCYATGTINSSSYAVGGLVGTNQNTITNSYTLGNVSSSSNSVGGLVGENFNTISYCYAIGTASGSSNVGGLVGLNFGGITASFWDTDTSNNSVGVGYGTPSGVTGRTTDQMKTLSTFTSEPNNWDFTNETVNGTNDYWRMCVDGVDYPHLTWEYVQHGDFACPDGVNFSDYSFLAARWLNTNCAANNDCDGADLDFSGKVDWTDMMMFAEHWLASQDME